MSLRNIHGQLNDLINHINQESDFERIRTLINKFKHKFIETDSDMFKIFNRISTSNIFQVLNDVFKSKDLESDILIDDNSNPETNVDIPHFILIEIIFNEIIVNLRHRDKNEKIKIKYSQSKDYLFITISNKIGSCLVRI